MNVRDREMSAIYDNWERLVAAVLNKEHLSQVFDEQSSTSSLSSSSDFSFSRLNSSLDDVPFAFSSPDWSASNHQSDVQHFRTKHFRRKNLTIQVPKPETKACGFICDPMCSQYCSIVSPTRSSRENRDDAKQESYPLPLPATAISYSSHVSPPKSAAKLPSPPSGSPKGAENVKSPGSSWKKGKLLGKDLLLGNVYLCFNSEKGKMCAMKEVSLSSKDAESKQNIRILEKEIALLSRINHPNIVQYYGSEMVADSFYIYFEYVSGGSINMILQQYGRFGESVISNYTRHILSGLAYLHSKGIAHRDIKGASVLVDPNGKVKLCNFAFEQHIAEESRLSWFMDNFYWMAPEFIMNSNERKLAVDIWSLGCTVLEMATARPPLSQYDRGVALFKIANHEELPQFPDHLSDVCKDFLRHCLQWNPLHRATASQLLEHPFVKSSWPLGKQILVSTSSGYPASTNAAKSEGTDHARIPHQLDSGEVVSRASKASKSNFHKSDIYTPRNISAPVSPVRSPLPHPRSAPVSPVGSPRPHHRSAPVSPVWSPLPHPRPAPISLVGSPRPHPSSASASPVESPLPHPRSASASPVGSPLPHPRSASASPVGSPLPHPRSAPVSPVGSPLPHPRSAPASPVGCPRPHPKSAPASPVGSPRPHPMSASASPVGSPLPHPRSASASPVGSPLPHPRSAPISPVWSPLPHPRSAPVSPVGSPRPHPRSAPASPVGSPLPHPRSDPVSPVKNPHPHPRSPQHLNRLTSPPTKTSLHTPPKHIITGFEATPHSPLNQSLLLQDTSYNLAKTNIPSYWTFSNGCSDSHDFQQLRFS